MTDVRPLADPDAHDADDPVRSPVTGGPTSLADTFKARVIVDRWKSQSIDVADYFAGHEEVQLRRCDSTGYRFFHPPSLAGEADFYDFMDPVASDDPDYRHSSEEFEFAVSRLNPGERVLDVGCGYGYFLDRAGTKAQVVGLEANEHAWRVAASRHSDVRHGRLHDVTTELRETFDVACAFQTLEHTYDVAGFFEGLKSVVKPGGRIIIAVPNNDPYLQHFNKYATWNTPPHHIGLWDLPSLEAAGRYFGLEPVEHAYLNVSKRPLVATYFRAAFWMGVQSELHHETLLDKLRILVAAPFAFPLALYELATRGRTEAENIIIVLRKRARG